MEAIKELESLNLAIVIPAFNVENEIEAVLKSIPPYVDHIILVDDASTDGTRDLLVAASQKDTRINLIIHDRNQGVGGATISGFRKAMDLQVEVVVKFDGDGQMDSLYLPELIKPIIENRADYTKGNRFSDFIALRQMPQIRRFGNTMLGFLCKVSTLPSALSVFCGLLS